MKKIVFIFAILFSTVTLANVSHRVCGVDTLRHDYAYSGVVNNPEVGRLIGSWAVGNGCGGVTENLDVATMCTKVIAGGQASCFLLGNAGEWSTTGDLDENTADYGNDCWCRRTKMQVGGELRDSIGQWVNLGMTDDCFENCAKYCAENVANNLGGMHHAIMVLPAF